VERRQVTEIPPVKAEVTEHQMIERECPCCGERTRADAPDRVTAPVRYGPRATALGTYQWHGQFLYRGQACVVLQRPGLRERRADRAHSALARRDRVIAARPPCCRISLSSATGTPSRKPRYTCLPMIR